MNDLINFLTSKEIIVVYIVAILACILCFVIHMIDKNYYKRKQRHNTKELNKLVEQINEIIEKEESSATEECQTPVLETIVEEKMESPIIEPEKEEVVSLSLEDLVLETMTTEAEKVEEELQYTTIEPNREQAQEELMRLTAELEKAEQESRNIDLTSYEEEQEENAIISLEELVRKSKEMYAANELTQYADEGNEPISLEDLEKKMQEARELITEEYTEVPEIIETLETENIEVEAQPRQMHLDDFNTIKVDSEVIVKETQKVEVPLYQATKKFERSPVISPIYGIERKETQEEIELENTANYEKLDEEIKKTNEFLMTLRELQKNLD